MENNYYGAPENSDNKPLVERLRDYYAPEDFVKVQNIDTSPVTYQFSNPKDEQFISNAPYHGEIHRTAPPTVVTLQPGEVKLCPAFEADRMITVLVKQITQNNTQRKIDTGQLRAGSSADWNDPNTQRTLIDRIFLGKQDLVSEYNQQVSKPAVEEDIEKDLQLDEPVARRGRPAKASEAA